MITEVSLSKKNNRLNGILTDLNSRRRFIELHGIDRAGACLLRNEHYHNGNVRNTKEHENQGFPDPQKSMDLFDQYSRFFLLRGNFEFPPKYLILKAINRKYHDLLPSELSLYGREELIDLCQRKGICQDPTKLMDSTMSKDSKIRLQELLKKFEGSKSIYEVGGLCGSDQSRLGTIGLIYFIARIACQERWDFEIQSCHPRHLGIYLASGLPYRQISSIEPNVNSIPESYIDYLGRSAVTLYIEGEELREKFPALERKLLGISEKQCATHT